MCLWTRLRLSISKKFKTRVSVFSLYTTAFPVVLAQEPRAHYPRSFRTGKYFPSQALSYSSTAGIVCIICA